VYLELGGKSPNIVFADAEDLDRAAKTSAMAIFRNSGQVCVAGSRLLLERGVHAEFVQRLKAETERLSVGDPLDLRTQIGAVSSEQQLAKNLAHVRLAEFEGAERVCGGGRILTETGGSYMAPAVFDNVTPAMSLFQNEVFGPVLSVTPFDGEDEAIRLANATDYGLAAAVWTGNLGRAHRMVAAIDAGLVHVNCYGGADVTVPLSGHRQSGNGADKSLYSFNKYLALKTAWIDIA
jgi:gamma-glutamyl-gamma-aminobutyraldehyde dehydrogenase